MKVIDSRSYKACLLILFMLTAHPVFAKQPIICKNKYALCNAAICQPIPGQADKVLCKCSIWKGKNIGFSSCKDRQEKETKDGDQAIVSTFSFGGNHYKYMSCPSGQPWANCLDHPCLIDKNEPDQRRAFCSCDLVREKAFVTFAGECETKHCSKAIWSGASIQGNQELMSYLSKALKIDTSQSICPSKE